MTRLSNAQQVILARLAAGWTLCYHRRMSLEMRDRNDSIVKAPHGGAVLGLKRRGLIELMLSPDNEPESRWFRLTEAGRRAMEGVTP